MALIGPIKYGGLNTKTNFSTFGSPLNGNWADVPMGQMTVCNDFNSQYGVLIPRPATAILSNQMESGAIVFGITSWVDAANWSQGQIIFCVVNQKLYSHAFAYNQSPPVSFNNVTGTATISGGPYQFASLNNILCGFGASSSTGIPFQVTVYNGNASNLPGTPPHGDIVKVVNNLMFVGRQLGSSTTFSTINWSAFGDPTTWPSASSLTFRNNDGDRIVAFGSIGTDLYIFKFNSIGRLSTNSISISGTITLGPLVTLFTGIGALTPFSVGNLPDGRIIFLGSNAHLYILDGFTLTDISDNPLPGINVQKSLDDLTSTGLDGTGVPSLIVYPTHNQVIVFGGGSNSRFLVYDYKENFWSRWTSLNPQSMTTVPMYDFVTPSAGYFSLPYSLLEGSNSGRVVQLDNSGVFMGAGDDTDTTSSSPTCTINVPLTGDYYGFIPRSLLLPISDSSMGTTISGLQNALIVNFGYDGTFVSSASFTMQNGVTYPNVLVIPIPQTKESGTSVRPMTLQIKITMTNLKVVLHPFYLSDEVLN